MLFLYNKCLETIHLSADSRRFSNKNLILDRREFVIMNNDLSIFTNKNENGIKLSDRMNTLLTNSKYFDVLVGYFRITGFYLLKEKLENVEEIRILIGLGTDIQTIKAVDIFEASGANSIKKLQAVVKKEFNETPDDSLEMENGIIKFCEWIKSGKLKIRMCYEKNVHAKLYIVRKDPSIVPDQYGNLITGSSNFTYNGLDKNVEFNVELKDQFNVRYALDFFDELWKSSKDVTNELLETVTNDTWMKKDITPYELFLKTLFVYFDEEIDSHTHTYSWPDGYMALQYQADAVTQAMRILARHGGVIISDVVGLGKTYIAAKLGKLLDGRKLFIVPPVVMDNWESVLSDFGYRKTDKVVSLGKVNQISQWEDLDSFKYVFVDEAHRFRNATSTEFQYLKKICYGKGVILITATPQNNTILDIANLITLFQDSRNSSIIPDTRDLDKYFKDRYKEVKDSNNDSSVISDVASKVRDEVLRHVLIRRTRTEISKYYKDDLEKQGLSFPIVNDPTRLDYMYDDEMEQSFNETIELLKKLSYARYAPLLYLKNKKKIGSYKARQQNMIGFVKTMLIKRLESSIFAFMESVNRIKQSSEGFINLYNKGKVVVGAASKTKYDFYDLNKMEEDAFNNFVETNEVECFSPNEFVDGYIDKVKKDAEILEQIYRIWAVYDIRKRDKKYKRLKEVIDYLGTNKQIIIFSEAKDTVMYLSEMLKNDYGSSVIEFSGSDSMAKKQYIQDNFDPKFDGKRITEKRILVTTDSLSEGINLHKASVIINYDLPWNPTRVMQRLGRINRVGSNNYRLYIYNFFPRANTKEHLSLEDSIKAKVQMFNELLGEDSKTITEDEHVSSFNLYDFLMTANKLEEEENLGSNAVQMSYIKLVNDIITNQPKLAEKIQKLPDKIRIARNGKTEQLITFIKQGWIKKFITFDGNSSKEIEFETAIRILEATPEEHNIEIPKDYFEGLTSNKDLYNILIIERENEKLTLNISTNEKKVRQVIKAMMNSNQLTSEDKSYLKKINQAIKRGSLNNRIFRDLKKSLDGAKTFPEMIRAIKKNVDEMYLTERKNYDITDSLKKPQIIVLSEYLKGGELYDRED